MRMPALHAVSATLYRPLAITFLFGFAHVPPPAFAQPPVWEWTNPQPTGSNLFAVTFVDQYTAYAAGDGGVVMRTTDGGQSWSSLETHTGYALTGIQFANSITGFAVSQSGLIMRTDTAGQAWTFLNSPSVFAHQGIAVHDETNALAVGPHSIARTVDGGVSWNYIYKEDLLNDSGYFAAVRFTTWPAVVVAGGIGQVAKALILTSSDGGETWTLASVPDVPGLHGLDFVSPVEGTAVGDAGTILHTADGGNTWSTQSSPTAQNLSGVAHSGPFSAVAVGNGGRIIRTEDGGVNWTIQSSGTDFALRAVAFGSPNIGIAVGDNGTILRTVDGGVTWSSESTSTTYGGLQGIAFADADHGMAVGFNGVIVHTTDGGLTWTHQNSHTATTLDDVAMFDAQHAVVVGSGGRLLYTEDGGTNWVRRPTDEAWYFYAVDIDDAQTAYAAGGRNIVRSSDRGWTWGLVQNVSPGTLFEDITVVDSLTAMACDIDLITRTDDGGDSWSTIYPDVGYGARIEALCFVDANVGTVVGNGLIARTTDGGMTWTRQDSGTARMLQSVDFLDASTGIAVGDYGEMRFTSDGGATWRWNRSTTANWLKDVHITPNGVASATGDNGTILQSLIHRPVAILIQRFSARQSPDGVQLSWELFADEYVTGFDILRRADGGTTEQALNKELIPGSTRGFLDTEARAGGTYDYTLVARGVASEIRSAPVTVTVSPVATALYQNQPNPFNPTTLIRYSIANTGRIQLRVYAISGALVRTLVDAVRAQGWNETAWDGRNDAGRPVASGVYFYRLTVGEWSSTRKLVLLR